ncbi:MAG: hypothetical protein VB022_08470 [Rikenellaceae bacterium]|nr:hypothetical protein [Rikenellaceae bacterium]
MEKNDIHLKTNMREQILEHQNEAGYLEMLYRSNRALFKKEFLQLYSDLSNNPLAGFWYERFREEKREEGKVKSEELIVVIVASIVAAIIAKLPAILDLAEETFYVRNVGFVVFPVLAGYFTWKNSLSRNTIFIISAALIAGAVFINLLPNIESDTTTLSCIHILLLLWAVLGFAFVGSIRSDSEKRLAYLKYNGDLAIMSGLLLIAGLLLSGVTVGLFELLGLKIENFYFNYIGIVALSCLPIIATYLIEKNPQLVSRITPVIARIFSPLVLIMLLVYLVAMIYSGKDPYNDRDFLMMFNALLVGVMAVIFFSVAGDSSVSKKSLQIWILFLLSAVTVIVNGIALSAILFRISEWGISPNRAAVLGANLLILANLLIVSVQLFKAATGKREPETVGKAISGFLPVYIIWAAIVTFGFPILF